MDKKYLVVSIDPDDNQAKKLSEVLSSRKCKEIIDHLAENNASQKDLADALRTPINTIEYNLKKLLEAGIVEKTSSFFWSVKGKKIPTYKLSNKSILISPKRKVSSKLKSILPSAIIGVIGAFVLRSVFKQNSKDVFFEKAIMASSRAGDFASSGNNDLLLSQPGAFWIWFLAGVLITLLVFSILNWRRL